MNANPIKMKCILIQVHYSKLVNLKTQKISSKKKHFAMYCNFSRSCKAFIVILLNTGHAEFNRSPVHSRGAHRLDYFLAIRK